MNVGEFFKNCLWSQDSARSKKVWASAVSHQINLSVEVVVWLQHFSTKYLHQYFGVVCGDKTKSFLYQSKANQIRRIHVWGKRHINMNIRGDNAQGSRTGVNKYVTVREIANEVWEKGNAWENGKNREANINLHYSFVSIYVSIMLILMITNKIKND